VRTLAARAIDRYARCRAARLPAFCAPPAHNSALPAPSPTAHRPPPAPPTRPPPKRRAKRGESDKNLKGLRHFSIKVCQKVEEKKCTTYNEVADALVKEYIEGQMAADELVAQVGAKKYDEKNIRRRVYDALNVLMAMDIISKEKKEITWRGLPSNATMDFDVLERQRQQIGATIARKKRHLQDKVRQLVAFKQLLERNGQANAEAAAADTKAAAAAAAKVPSAAAKAADKLVKEEPKDNEAASASSSAAADATAAAPPPPAAAAAAAGRACSPQHARRLCPGQILRGRHPLPIHRLRVSDPVCRGEGPVQRQRRRPVRSVCC
jgi:hypothetical protein